MSQNLGTYRNIQSVLGPNPLLWLWPQSMRSDGLSFPVNPEAGGESAIDEWVGVAGRDGPLSAPEIERSTVGSLGDALQGIGSSNGVQAVLGTGGDRMRLSRGAEDSMV